MKDTLLVVDGNSLMHRAFHALPLMDADGVYTNAVHGFLMMLFKVFREMEPRYAAVAFDEHAPTFRHRIYGEYKAGRRATPEELKSQFPLIREVLAAMGIGVLSCEGWEADDILGTLARRCAEREDLSALLLTGDRDALQLVTDGTRVLFTRKGISETTLFTPAAVRETFGVSPEQVTDLKGLMGDSSDNIPGIPGVGEKTAVKLLQEWETLEEVLAHADEIKGKLGEKVRAYADQARFSRKLATIVPEAPVAFDYTSWELNRLGGGAEVLRRLKLSQALQQVGQLAPVQAAPRAEENAPEAEEITDIDALRAFLKGEGETALHLEENEMTLCRGGKLAKIALGGDLLGGGMDPAAVLAAVSEAVGACTVHDAKRWKHLFERCGLACPEFGWDTMLAQYLINPQEKSYALSRFARADAWGVAGLCREQRGQIAALGTEKLMREVELPLSQVLADMETEGFRVDREVLRELGRAWSAQAEALQEEIYTLTGVRGFNLNSPQQLSRVLFEELGLKHGKKTSRGYATDADTLEGLREEHPAVGKILEYRQVVKLNSTYAEALIEKTDADGRIHSVFDQTGTVTGRISSSEPNLQNIPVRTEQGREIRRAFIPAEGWVLTDADYSQIELRILAHLSGDEAMTDAFRRGQDIHARTAAEVYGVPLEDVTPAMRRSAKAVNFGLVYGISEFGLARNLGIGRWEAHDFIARYFEKYPGVHRYMEESVAKGYRDGYTETVLGRRRPLPELKSPNGNMRSFGERVAMNAPVQGSAADIIKLAMVRVHGELKQRAFRSRLILQVHDELLIEGPREEAEEVSALLKECMEGAWRLSVPLSVEIHTGESWFETK